ncbi:interferon-induced transmembrane protein 3-like [Tachysurus fulvidraco]|uniref:interferon-induced transmembrane protein 3-like n=1 Tax=Tachysurus fulvidraco TaxID=1234273 RepID=UPI000F4EDB63|nr:interferon-induced transmembrane protein 3-like [Tachysurus fulvidraco]
MQSPMVPLNAPLGDGGGARTVVVSMPEHPPDYAAWSVCSMSYGNPCCLGLIALIFSMKSRDQKMVGNMTTAKNYGSTACCLNGFALGLSIVYVIIIIVIVFTYSV